MNDNIFILVVMAAAGICIIIVGFILLQVRNQNKLLQKQKQLAAEEIKHHKALLESVISSQEIERRRIGNDLHDEVGAILSSLRMLIEKQDCKGSSTIQKEFVNQSKGIIDNVIKKVRQISHNLSPHINGDFWFYDAMIELSETINVTDSIRLTLDFDEEEIPHKLDSYKTLALYRVFTELINNTLKHAGANVIRISITTLSNVLQISYSDDGKGFNQDAVLNSRGMGFKNIESRLDMIGATWHIQKESTKGFALGILVPLANPQEKS